MGDSSAFFCFGAAIPVGRERADARVESGSDATTDRQRGRKSPETGPEESRNGRRGEREIYRDIPESLRALIEPVVDEHDCELVDVEVTRPRGPGLLRIVVDSRAGDGRVPIERCAAISRELSTLLDATDFMPGAYRLEVSSPGLDRVLAREKDFEAAVGREIRAQTRRPLDGRKRYRGRLVAFESGVVRVEVDGELTEIPFEDIEKANTIYEFTSADFAKSSKARDSSQSGGM
ncbi:MAG: ribosome maturation factor RimP [Myxococcota bacterium]